jgi:hypothetical protein
MNPLQLDDQLATISNAGRNIAITMDVPINDPDIRDEFEKSLMSDRKGAQTDRVNS